MFQPLVAHQSLRARLSEGSFPDRKIPTTYRVDEKERADDPEHGEENLDDEEVEAGSSRVTCKLLIVGGIKANEGHS